MWKRLVGERGEGYGAGSISIVDLEVEGRWLVSIDIIRYVLLLQLATVVVARYERTGQVLLHRIHSFVEVASTV
jgi:hypothetical protein